MKKIIFTLVILCSLIFHGYAQITLNHWDVAAPLTKFLQYNDSMPSPDILPGSPGAGKTWDFTSLQKHTVDTILFTNPQWTQNISSFPNSNLCMLTTNSTTSYLYLINSTDSLVAIGQAGNIPGISSQLVARINPPRKIIDFPTTYQSSFTNTSSFSVTTYFGQPPVDSIKFKEITTLKDTVDAWGSITTPLGVFDCLRKTEYQTSIDSLWVKNNYAGFWAFYTTLNNTSKTYSWWVKSLGFILAEIKVDPVTDSVISANYLGTLPQPGGYIELPLHIGATIFPNPASESISITSNQFIKNIEIYNSCGELVKLAEMNNTSGNVNITSLPKSIYFIRFKNADGFTIYTKKLIAE